MKFSQVQNKCKEYGIEISRNGLYLAGLKYGFIERGFGNNIFHKEKFEEWVEKKLEKIPEGYYSILECSKKLNMSKITIYFIIAEGNIETKEIGTKKVKYVKYEELKKYIRIRKFGSEEKYGN